MPLVNHPQRTRIVSEMHLRPMPPLHAPCRMVQIVRLVDDAEREAELDHAQSLLDGRDAIRADRRHLSGTLPGGVEFAWERHSEASTATLILPGLEPADGEDRAIGWIEDLPGTAMRAVEVDIVETETDAEPKLRTAGFRTEELVSCRIGAARIWSDFRLRDGGYGYLLVAAGGTHPADLGRLVQQLQELGNYRNLALLGLPVAQAGGTAVADIESRLVAATGKMTEGGGDRELLDELIDLASAIASLRAATGYRMSATRAYGQIVEERLQALKPQKIESFYSLTEFTERRLLPALRTCESFRKRLEAVATRTEEATAMLRTRVDLALQDQNSALLRSMDNNARRQLRLQRLVEGLSVIAVSYYAVALLGYLIAGAEPWLPLPRDVVHAVAVVPTLIVFWLFLRWRMGTADPDKG